MRARDAPPACPSTAATPATTRGPRPAGRTSACATPRTTGPCTATGSFPTMWSRSSSSDHGTRDIRERSCHSGNHIRTPRTHTRATRHATERTRNLAGRETPTRHIRPAGNPNRTRPHGQSRTHKLAYNPRMVMSSFMVLSHPQPSSNLKFTPLQRFINSSCIAMSRST